MCSSADSSGAGNQYSRPIQYLLALPSHSEKDVQTIASQLIDQVTTARWHDVALWELWVAFFEQVPTASYIHCVALLRAIRAHPPTTPNNAEWSECRETEDDGPLYWAELPRFGLEWREQHDDHQQRRDRAAPAAERYINFVRFSAAWIKDCGGDVGIDTVLVFLLSRDVLENVHPGAWSPKGHCLSTEQLWALDVKLAGIWVRDGAQALWNMDQSDELLQKYWGRAMAMETELWPRDDGLSRGRWLLWQTRLRALSEENDRLDEVTREILTQAVAVVDELLGFE